MKVPVIVPLSVVGILVLGSFERSLPSSVNVYNFEHVHSEVVIDPTAQLLAPIVKMVTLSPAGADARCLNLSLLPKFRRRTIPVVYTDRRWARRRFQNRVIARVCTAIRIRECAVLGDGRSLTNVRFPRPHRRTWNQDAPDLARPRSRCPRSSRAMRKPPRKCSPRRTEA